MAVIDSAVIQVQHAMNEYAIEQEVHVTAGAGALTANILQLTGSVLILSQHAQITEVTALTNLTSVWADLWDGTFSDPLTAIAGADADLSGLPVGSWFTRDHDETQPYDVIDATACSQYTPAGPKLGDPFTVTQKTAGVDTFLRVRGTAGAEVDFRMLVKFRYSPIDSGLLVFV